MQKKTRTITNQTTPGAATMPLMYFVGIEQIKHAVIKDVPLTNGKFADFYPERVTPEFAIGEFRLDGEQWTAEIAMEYAMTWPVVKI